MLTSCTSSPDGSLLDGFTIVTADPSDSPLKGLDDDLQDRFNEGDALFEAVLRDSQGLGPNYIRFSCASCHADDARGPGVVTKMILVEPDGITPSADQSALPWGHTARPQVAGGAVSPLSVPDDLSGLLITTRSPPAVFGRGYLEAVLDSEIERVETEQAARGDAINGRIHRVTWQSERNTVTDFHTHGPGDVGLIGRFGLKARIATLDEFTADAYQGDMSITSPMRPAELANPDNLDDDYLPGIDIELDTINLVTDYVRLLDIPTRTHPAGNGAPAFEQADCAVCHVPTLHTRANYAVPVLADIDAPIFTDMLLHDMGDDAADGFEDGDATSSEWQTPPLIGLRHLRSFMHDARALTVETAILAHEGPGSEANDSVAAFLSLSPSDQADLIAYVESL
jgi:CxxC motif-containing protein (DUF1111 family)